MFNFESTTIIFFAFLLDLLIGDPQYRFHPIRIMGRGITFFLKVIKRHGLTGKGGGLILVIMITLSSLAVFMAIHSMLYHFYPPLTLVFDLFICYSCLALKDLAHHIRPVVTALEAGNPSKAGRAVAMVVGRDVSCLDRDGIARAAMETLAENFVDGFLSPVFWYVTGGMLAFIFGLSSGVTALCFMIIFKVASTLDSMVGYKNKEFSEIGCAGARLDDFMNFVPARLSIFILYLGAWTSGLDSKGGIRTALRDRLKHDSPNAAHAESFVAGAFHVRLGGPTRYPDILKNKPWLGDGSLVPGPEHIQKTITLLNHSAWISIAVAVAALVFFT